jgi:MIP family channel proteins
MIFVFFGISSAVFSSGARGITSSLTLYPQNAPPPPPGGGRRAESFEFASAPPTAASGSVAG